LTTGEILNAIKGPTSIKDFMDMSGVTDRTTAQRQLDNLVAKGYLDKIGSGTGRGKEVLYNIKLREVNNNEKYDGGYSA
jgi:predicted HTH transcriptional regulator